MTRKGAKKKRGTSSHARLVSFNSLISSNNNLWLGRKQVTCYKTMEPMYVQKRAEIGWLRASMNTTSDSKIRIYTIRQLELSLSWLFNKTTRKRIPWWRFEDEKLTCKGKTGCISLTKLVYRNNVSSRVDRYGVNISPNRAIR